MRKNNMKSIIQHLLAYLAKNILRIYHPRVIGITGSVGKTSAKEAITLALNRRARVRSSEKNYNNEFGVPLTIIGASESPGRSLFGWIGVMLRALSLLMIRSHSYPNVLVLEMGADRPGDIETLTKIAPCNIGVLTAIGPAHLEKFGTMEALIKEKKIIVRNLPVGSIAIVNADDPFIYPIDEDVRVRVMTFGCAPHADVRAHSLVERYVFSSKSHEQPSLTFECDYKDQSCEIELRGALGRQSIYAVLAGLAVSCALDIPLIQAVRDIQAYRGPSGRMRIIQGIKNTLLIDDTYNSSPLAAREALAALCAFRIDESARRIAVLGDMLELGTYTEQEHRTIGALCAEFGVTELITVGPLAKWIAEAAIQSGIDTAHIFSFDTAEEAGNAVRNIMRQGDVVLIKGSQGVRLEKTVKEIMAEPERAGELLIRQGKEWA